MFYFGELYAINWAFETLLLTRILNSSFSEPAQVTILSDSQSALRALRAPARQSGQWVFRQISQGVHELERQKGHVVVLRWVPSHADVKENERADLAARAATEVGKAPEKELPCLKSTV